MACKTQRERLSKGCKVCLGMNQPAWLKDLGNDKFRV